MPLALAALFAVLVAALVVGFVAVTMYNAVVALQRRIDKAWANIEVGLKQRHDQLPNLVAAVRGLMAFEAEVLGDIARLRAAYDDHAPIPQQATTSVATTRAVRQLIGVVEAYPELRSAHQVRELQDEITRLEDILADRRELYNDQVYRYNTRIAQVPAVLVAGLFGWRPRPFFDAAEGSGEG